MNIQYTNRPIGFILRAIFFILSLLSLKVSYSQIIFRNQPQKYYEILINNMNHPDSLYIYEVNSSWGSGVAYFLSFKNSCLRTGYYLNNNFINRILASRGLLPSDSLNNIFRVIETKIPDNNKQIIGAINSIFLLPDEANIKNTCFKDFIADGSEYQFSKITMDTSFFKSYYEIYEYAKLCPNLKEYKYLIGVNSLLNKSFPHSREIVDNLIIEYRVRKK